jgi:hypothetical protein
MAENPCQLFMWQGINNQNTQGAQKLNSIRINKPINKWENEFERSQNGQQIPDEMFKTPGHQGNTNQDTLRFHCTIVRMAIIKIANDKFR